MVFVRLCFVFLCLVGFPLTTTDSISSLSLKTENAEVVCDYPLVEEKSGNSTKCVFPICPQPVFNNDENASLEITVFLWNSVSCCILIFTFFSWVFATPKILFPSGLLGYCSFSLFSLHLTLIWGAINYKTESYCENSTKLNQINICQIQGGLTLFFANSTLAWWTLYMHFISRKIIYWFRTDYPNSFVLHFIGFVLPAIIAFVAFYFNKIGHSAGNLWCFVSDEQSGLFQFIFFYGFLFISSIFVFVMIVIVLIHLKSALRNFTSATTDSFVFCGKMVIIVFLLIIYILCVVLSQFFLVTQKNEIQRYFADWSQSLENGSSSSNKFISPANFFGFRLAVALVSSTGSLIGLVMGINKDVIVYWKAKFSRKSSKEFQNLKETPN